MTINNFMTTMIFIVMFLYISIFTIDLLTPFYKKADFQLICQEYNQIIVQKGKLTSSEVTELRRKLEEKDIKVSTLNFPTSTVWGDSFTFEVIANYSHEVIKIDLKKEIKIHNFRYRKTGVSLKGAD